MKTKQITVNGEVVTKPETKVEPENDQISYKGESVIYCEYEYYLFYKPAGCVTATEDHDQSGSGKRGRRQQQDDEFW